MSSLSSLYIKTETLKTILQVLEKKGDKGIELTLSLGDETNQYGQNLSSWVSQLKEDRDADKPRFYVGNGKCFWTDGKITKAVKPEAQPEQPKTSGKYDDSKPPF